MNVRIPALLFALMVCSGAWAESVKLAGFGQAGWEVQEFEGRTEYVSAADGSVTATANGTASGLVWKQKIDLEKTPFLNWRWSVAELPGVTDELKKSGDDYAARVYVVVDGGWLKWRTKALNYVWSARQKAGDDWDSPYLPKNVKMFAVAGAGTPLNLWRTEKRNVAADFQKMFGKDIKSIDAVAIMTDADNSQSTSKARFAELFFSAE